MVRTQAAVADHLGVRQWLAVVGGSMGGMQALEWGVMYPDRVRSLVPIATAAAASAQQIGWWSAGRRAIRTDPRWRGGEYYDAEPGDGPHDGLATARMISMMTFRSDDVFSARFGREVVEPIDGFSLWQRFQVERYLEYQGDKLVRRFDTNSHLILTKAMDLHDLARGRNGFGPAFGRLRCPILSVGISSDILYPPHQARSIAALAADAGVPATYAEIDSPHGHDAFLIEDDQLTAIVRPFLDAVEAAMTEVDRPDTEPIEEPTAAPTAGARPPGTPRPARSGPGGGGAATRWRPCCSRHHLRGGLRGRAPAPGGPRAPSTSTPASAAPPCGDFEDAVADLEGAEAALASASGMAAITSVIFGLCSTGRPRRRPAPAVLGHRVPAAPALPRFGIDVTLVDGTDPQQFADAVRPGRTQVVLVETPANPALSLTDIEAVSAIQGPFTVVDSTFATPAVQRPLDLGVDLVVHAATKGLAGHNDALLGVVAGEPRAHRRHLGLAHRPGRPGLALRRLERPAGHPHVGAPRAPAVRDRPAPGRAPRASHPALAEVMYPGLDSHPQRELAKRQMTIGRHRPLRRAGRGCRCRPPVLRLLPPRPHRPVAGRPRDAADPPGHHRRRHDAVRAGRDGHPRRHGPHLGGPRAPRRPHRRPRPGPGGGRRLSAAPRENGEEAVALGHGLPGLSRRAGRRVGDSVGQTRR